MERDFATVPRQCKQLEHSDTDQSGNINSRGRVGGSPLQTTSHSKELIQSREVVLSVPFGDRLLHTLKTAPVDVEKGTNIEQLDMIQDLVIEGKVIAGDDSSTSLLLEFPVSGTKVLAGFNQLIGRNLASPVGLCGLLELTIRCGMVSQNYQLRGRNGSNEPPIRGNPRTALYISIKHQQSIQFPPTKKFSPPG
jgi:hypothetical protein